MPLFADYRPDVRGSLDDQVLVRDAVAADVPGIVGVAATRSALLAGLMTWTWARTTVLRSVVNAGNLPSIELHRRRGFREVARGATFAGIAFEGGTGVLLRADRPGVPA